MRLASVSGRATLVTSGQGTVDTRGVDVATASDGRFGPDTASLYPQWDDFRNWAESVDPTSGQPVDTARLGNPSPAPTQVFGIGLNYLDHAAEAGLDATKALVPPTFTKFPTSLADPYAALRLPSDRVDWEVELVVVVGRHADHVTASEAWAYVAGLSVGQDYSERDMQRAGPVPQFSLGKSYRGFGPIGPWLVTVDEFADPDDLAIACDLNGEQVQKSRTSNLVWSVPALIEVLSAICPLMPGDVIFTGTPAGVGAARSPQRYLAPGDVVVSRIEGIGEIRQECLAGF